MEVHEDNLTHWLISTQVTRSYGIEIMSINIISAAPVDDALTKSLASRAVWKSTFINLHAIEPPHRQI